MAISFTDLLKQANDKVINPVLSQGIIGTAVSGFVQGLGGDVPQFSSQVRSVTWLLEQARNVRRTTVENTANSVIKSTEPNQILAQAQGRDDAGKFVAGNQAAIAKPTNAMQVGDMVMYVYDPKTKDKLPYYDTFPLIFPIELKNDGWLGINMHYLPPQMRATLMDSLYSLVTNTNMDTTTRLQLSYQILKGASKFGAFKPCIKRYLTSHVRSVRLTVHPSQWDMVLMLPTARFVKADQLKVWSDSMDKIRKSNR